MSIKAEGYEMIIPYDVDIRTGVVRMANDLCAIRIICGDRVSNMMNIGGSKTVTGRNK